MRYKFFFILALVLSFGLLNVSAQTPTPNAPKLISGGVLNGKAKSLAKPAFPAAARAVNASGAVNVQVTIDENGDVISASAVSGHPLLRQASEQAALASKFAPTLLQGQPVRVTGVIIYNFVDDSAANWFKVGYDLANVQHTFTLKFLNTNAIDKNFQVDWTTEKEQLQRLGEIKQSETSSTSQSMISGERKINENTEQKLEEKTYKAMIVEKPVKSDNQTTGEQLAIVQSLIVSLQGRLANDELKLWQFNTGLSVSEAWVKVGIPSESQRVLDSIRQQIQSAPTGVSAEYLSALQQISTTLEKPNLTPEDRWQILQIIPKLSRN